MATIPAPNSANMSESKLPVPGETPIAMEALMLAVDLAHEKHMEMSFTPEWCRLVAIDPHGH